MIYGTVLLIVWLHFIADFLFQSDWMAVNKSHNNKALTLHCLAYIFAFVLAMFCGAPFSYMFLVFNFFAHFGIDFVTSKVTAYLYTKGDKFRHWFFVMIGFDQALHLSVLLLTYGL